MTAALKIDQDLAVHREYAAALLLDALAGFGTVSCGQGQPGPGLTAQGLVLKGCPAVPQAELDEIFASASFVRELKTGRIDGLGRFDEGEIGWDITVPWIDRRVHALAASLSPNHGGLVRRKLKVLITHDVDRTTGCEPTAILNALLRAGRLRRSSCLGLRATFLPYALMRTIGRLLEYERVHGVGALYFMMAGPYGYSRYATRTDIRWRVSRQIAQLVRQAGMGVGLHGSFYARENNSYAEEKERLEQVVGVPVTMHRNHYLRFDTERFACQLEGAGMAYDFSAGFGTRVGFRTGCAHVYRAYDLLNEKKARLRLVPLVFMDTVLFCGDPDARLAELRATLQEAQGVGGCIALLFHPETLMAHQNGWNWFERVIGMCSDLGADLSGELQ
jgi:hypothetical protein